MNKCGLLLLLVIINIFSIHSQDKQVEKRPKLIVGIVIDQMRYDVITKYWDKFENNGFKRLVNEGIVCRNANYNFLVSRPEVSYSSIVTGAHPSVHGIISDEWYLRVTDKIINCTRDTNLISVGGSYASGFHSPKNLLVTTIGDELRMSNSRQSKVISISLDPSVAVLMGGNLASAAYWMDTESGKMVSCSNYQPILEKWVQDFNKKELPDAYIDRSWEPLNEVDKYFDSLSIMTNENLFRGQKKFPYDLRKASLPNGKKNYALLNYTPFGINYLKDFAISTIVNEKMGRDEFPDILYIGFSPTGNIAKTFGLNSMEMEDVYLRLDKEIRHLLDFIDGYVGKGNALIYVTSSQGGAYSPEYMKKNGMSTGYFNPMQAMALARSYLNAIYGSNDLIKHYSNLQYFLNKNKIIEKKLSYEKVQKDLADFLLDFTGVHHVLTADDLQHEGYSIGVNARIQNSYHPKRSGDVMVYLEPGWIEKMNNNYTYISANSSEVHVPLIWFGWKTKKKTVNRDIDMIDIAPTISTLLEIGYPNGCQGRTIYEIIE